jgi:hypothetical protein
MGEMKDSGRVRECRHYKSREREREVHAKSYLQLVLLASSLTHVRIPLHFAQRHSTAQPFDAPLPFHCVPRVQRTFGGGGLVVAQLAEREREQREREKMEVKERKK